MPIVSKSPKVSNDVKMLASPVPSQSTRHSVDLLASGDPELRAVGGSTTTDGPSSTEIVFDNSPDEPPPAYEALSALSPQTQPPQSSSSQVAGPSSPIQVPPTTPKPTPNRPYETGDSSGSQNNNSTQSHNIRPGTTHTPLSTDPLSCFQRAAPQPSELITYERLQSPLVIQGGPSKHKLPDLFSAEGIPALVKHDVRASDWRCFIHDLVTSTRYSTGQRIVAGAFPTVKCLGPPGALICLATEQSMRKGRLSNSLALLDMWNVQFFEPRGLEVILCKGDKCKSGRRTDFLAPDRMNTPISSLSNKENKELGADYRLVVIST
ncbi:unnamed protein product [Rhizoctonia solani]|uniref:Uncharacterized protein n=1 Tax=Rhizoctonia solani TaxID=456999 RepID=A0A8H3GQX9_9AGAM|nr:unnamed protein product [Rhizoctonia solani]